MAGANLWLLSLPEVTQQLQDPGVTKGTNELMLGCAVLQARAAVESSMRQEQANEHLIATSKELVQQTKQLATKTAALVRATFWVAGVTVAAALIAASAAVIAAGK